MPLIRVVEGRQVSLIDRDLAHVDARVGGGFRHWGRGQHLSPEQGAVATTNEAAIRENLRVMIPSW